ncbi:hypothetical protein D3C81_1339920 [compost metagenome]
MMVVVAEGCRVTGAVGIAHVEYVHHRVACSLGAVRCDAHGCFSAAVVPREEVLLLAHARPQPTQMRAVPPRQEWRQIGFAVQHAFLRSEGGIAVHHQGRDTLRIGPGQPCGDQAAGMHAEHGEALQADGVGEFQRGCAELGNRHRVAGQGIGVTEAGRVRCDHGVAIGIALHQRVPHA